MAIHSPRSRPAVIHKGAGLPPRWGTVWHDAPVTARFLTLADVAETLNISASQAYALVRSGELPAIKIGGRGQWRVENSALEDYIQRMYAQTKSFIDSSPEVDEVAFEDS